MMVKKQDYRSLTQQEIKSLARKGCRAQNWADITVSEEFNCDCLRNVSFSGKIKIAAQNSTLGLDGGGVQQTGIYDTTLSNCSIGENVYISQVPGGISNYTIEDNVVIRNVGQIAVDGVSSFGNGVEVNAVNEGGGREVRIFNLLSAQLAYIYTFYRHDTECIERLNSLVEAYADSVKSPTGTIGRNVRIEHAGRLINVAVKSYAVIEGAALLENGSINSCHEDPTHIGHGVIARNFIACAGSKIYDQAVISNCFIGEAAELGEQCSVHHCLFFANSEFHRGEACSLFAGPYTVSHHKSTLLIAGYTSFYNAGSGTNQSNHLFKLGPVHQGIMERGVKTGSGSYLIWPSRVGAFSAVLGKHMTHFDSSDLPFSYLLGYGDYSLCIPAAALRSIGTIRDAQKWKLRDKRKLPNNLDVLTLNLITPYIADKLLSAISILNQLQAVSDSQTDAEYKGLKIKASAIPSAIELYHLALKAYAGEILVSILRKNKCTSIEQVQSILSTAGKDSGNWIDISGLVIPQSQITEVVKEIKDNKDICLDALNSRFGELCTEYDQYEYEWFKCNFQRMYKKEISDLSLNELLRIVQEWVTVNEALLNRRIEDGQKEYSQQAAIGYGIDGEESVVEKDFYAVRSCLETNSFIKGLKKTFQESKKAAEDVIAAFKN